MKNVYFTITLACILISSELAICQVDYTVKNLNVHESIYSKDTNFLVIDIPDFQTTDEIGKPSMPVKYFRFALPRGMTAENLNINIIESKSILLDRKILPTQHPIPTKLYFQTKEFVKPNPTVYNSQKEYPGTIAKIVREGFFDGDIPIVTVAVYPIQYRPLNDEINVYAFEIELNYKKTFTSKSISKNKTNRDFYTYQKLLCATIDNDEDIMRFELNKQGPNIKNTEGLKSLTANYEYIIITSENLAPSFNEFMA